MAKKQKGVPFKGAPFKDSKLEKKSPFVQTTASFYLTLAPCVYHTPLAGLCAEHISPLLLTYYPPLKGIPLSYSNPRLSEHPHDEDTIALSSNAQVKQALSRSIDEYAVSFLWITAEFNLFRPSKGTYLEGFVNLQNESILGLICYNYFNAGIDQDKLPKDWSWRGEHYVDGQGKKVQGRIVFRVEDFEVEGGQSIQISGTLLEEG